MRPTVAILALTAFAFAAMAFLHLPEAQQSAAIGPGLPNEAPAQQASGGGELLQMSAIVALAERRFGGTVIEVEFEEKRERRYFEVKILPASGRSFEVELDAVTGQLLQVKGIDPSSLPVDTASGRHR